MNARFAHAEIAAPMNQDGRYVGEAAVRACAEMRRVAQCAEMRRVAQCPTGPMLLLVVQADTQEYLRSIRSALDIELHLVSNDREWLINRIVAGMRWDEHWAVKIKRAERIADTIMGVTV